MNNIMIDIETLDTTTSAVVLSIGAVKFNEKGLGETFHMTLGLDDQVKHGRTMSASTIQWWMKQSESARQSIVQEGLSPEIVLNALSSFMAGTDYKVWGNGAMFDNVIVSDLYKTYNIRRPWTYRGDRCYRTVRAEYKERNPLFNEAMPKVEHNALEDAIAQALTLQLIWNGGAE